MSGQSKLLKMGKTPRSSLFLPPLGKEKMLQICLSLPGGVFVIFSFVLCVFFVFKLSSGKANLR